MKQAHQTDREPGLNCPRCGTFIPTTIMQLLTTRSFRCSRCLLELRLDAFASRDALQALRKVQEAKEKVDNASKFRR